MENITTNRFTHFFVLWCCETCMRLAFGASKCSSPWPMFTSRDKRSIKPSSLFWSHSPLTINCLCQRDVCFTKTLYSITWPKGYIGYKDTSVSRKPYKTSNILATLTRSKDNLGCKDTFTWPRITVCTGNTVPWNKVLPCLRTRAIRV
jgi:hypothetical protein